MADFNIHLLMINKVGMDEIIFIVFYVYLAWPNIDIDCSNRYHDKP